MRSITLGSIKPDKTTLALSTSKTAMPVYTTLHYAIEHYVQFNCSKYPTTPNRAATALYVAEKTLQYLKLTNSVAQSHGTPTAIRTTIGITCTTRHYATARFFELFCHQCAFLIRRVTGTI